MKKIPLWRGRKKTDRVIAAYTMVDDLDYIKLSPFTWRYEKHKGPYTGYAKRYGRIGGQQGKFVVYNMARIILGLKDGCRLYVDHIDGDGLNNQRSNLRVCTNSQNQFNKRVQRNNTTGFRGVSPGNRKFVATISAFGEVIHLGTFPTKREAADAYRAAAKKYHGEYSNVG